MRTITFLALFLFPFISKAQVTLNDLIQINNTVQRSIDEVPHSYRKAYDFILTKGLMLRNSNIADPPPTFPLPTSPPVPYPKPKYRTYITLNFGDNMVGTEKANQNISLIVERSDTIVARQYFKYTTQLTTKSFQQYIKWRTDAQSKFASNTYVYTPFMDTFFVPEKDKTQLLVRITVSASDDRTTGSRTVTNEPSFYLFIERITYE